MSKKAALSLTALSLALGSAPVFAQSETAEGFIEGSTLSLIIATFISTEIFATVGAPPAMAILRNGLTD